ncbi:MAG: hypothetical protein HY296_00270 [Thaumarchaeota archaeon]|nr:hypothetical protein [Nitrososphaerota archaeon]
MRLLPIASIMVIAWLLMIAEVYAFFDLILNFAPPIHDIGSFTVLAILKVGLTLGLGVLWFLVMQGLAELYTASRLRSRTPTASS